MCEFYLHNVIKLCYELVSLRHSLFLFFLHMWFKVIKSNLNRGFNSGELNACWLFSMSPLLLFAVIFVSGVWFYKSSSVGLMLVWVRLKSSCVSPPLFWGLFLFCYCPPLELKCFGFPQSPKSTSYFTFNWNQYFTTISLSPPIDAICYFCVIKPLNLWFVKLGL